jgi:alginate O-acetyltransferase complex protein AlgJ
MLSASPAPERVSLRFVSREGDATGAPVAPDRASPVLLLGDSHTLVFHAGGDMHATGAGLPDQLARELGFAVDLVGVRGSGATPARINLARRAGALDGKRLVVWCFGARELTEAAQGWAKVPVVR